jgi:hypothetical protein
MPSRRSVRCRRFGVERRRRYWPRRLSAGELRPDASLPGQIFGQAELNDQQDRPRASLRHFLRCKGRRMAGRLPPRWPDGPVIWRMSACSGVTPLMFSSARIKPCERRTGEGKRVYQTTLSRAPPVSTARLPGGFRCFRAVSLPARMLIPHGSDHRSRASPGTKTRLAPPIGPVHSVAAKSERPDIFVLLRARPCIIAMGTPLCGLI